MADLAMPSTDTTNTYKGGNPWGNSWGSFSYTQQTEGLKEYDIPEENNYTYSFGGSNVSGKLVKCTNTNGKPRFYILALADIDDTVHFWYYSAYRRLDNYHDASYNDFGEGKTFTENMVNAWNEEKYGTQNGYSSYTDMWGIIQDDVKEGWFVPSRAEWAAFASYLNTTNQSSDSTFYMNYGLAGWYWSSAESTDSASYDAHFYHNYISDNAGGYVRLASTF